STCAARADYFDAGVTLVGRARPFTRPPAPPSVRNSALVPSTSTPTIEPSRSRWMDGGWGAVESTMRNVWEPLAAEESTSSRNLPARGSAAPGYFFPSTWFWPTVRKSGDSGSRHFTERWPDCSWGGPTFTVAV